MFAIISNWPSSFPSPLSVQWSRAVVFQDTLMAGTKKEDGVTHQSGRRQGEEEDTTRTEKLVRKPAVSRAKLFITGIWKIRRVPFSLYISCIDEEVGVEVVLIRFHYLNVQDKTASQIGSYSKPWKSDLNKTKCIQVAVFLSFCLCIITLNFLLFIENL